MSYGMRSNDYFSKYDDRFSSRNGSLNRSSGGGSMRYGGDSSFSQFRDRGEMFRDSYSRTNSSSFGSGMGGGFGDRRSTSMGMQDYDMGFSDMHRGRSEYNGRHPRSPLMRGMKRNMSPGSGFGGRSQGGMGMGGGFSSTEAQALLSLGMQAKQLLEKQAAAAYGPPAPKMRRLNEGYGRPMGRGRGMMRRGINRGGAARPRGGASRVHKPREIPAWRKTPFHCNFCHKATKNRKDHAEHVKTKEHSAAMKDREQKLVERMYSYHRRAQANAEHARMNGALVRFCGICTLEYTGKIGLHKKSKEHLAMVFLLSVKCPDCEVTISNRVQFERHNVTGFHIRNHMYKLMEADELDPAEEDLECPEEYDDSVGVGNQYVNDRRAIYCKVCDQLYDTKEVSVYNHCKTKEHFDNFKEFCVTRKAELEEKAAEKAKAAEEAAAAKEEETEEKEEEEAEEAAEDEEAVEGEAEEGIEGEADGEGEDAEEVDEAQALGEEDENEDVEMEEEAEKEEEPPAKTTAAKKSPAAAKARTTPKRNAKAK